MKHYLLTLISIILLAPGFGVCVAPEKKEIKVGVISALSGGMATLGTAVKNGIELARTDRPELFANISFHYEDDQFDAKQSVSAYRRLKSAVQVDLILGFGSILADSVGPLIEKDQIPLLNFNFESSSAVGKTYLIRSMNHTLQYMEVLGKHLRERGESELPIVSSESSFFNAMIKSLKASLNKSAALVPVANYNPTDTDFRSTIVKLKSMEPKHVGLFLLPNQLIAFMKQARNLGFEASYFGTDLFETSASLVPKSALFEGCLYPDNEVSKEFRSRYRKEFGNEAQLTFAGNAYEITLLVGELIQRQGSFDREKFMESLTLVQERQGSLGTFSYRNEAKFGRYFEFPVYIKTIKGPRGVPLG